MATPETKAAFPPSPEKAGKPTTLLDVYEVEWITRELERLLVKESGGAGCDGADARHRHHHHHMRKKVKVVSPVRSHDPHPHAKKGGFLGELLGKHAASICGDGGVAGAVVSGRRRRRGRGGFREVEKV